MNVHWNALNMQDATFLSGIVWEVCRTSKHTTTPWISAPPF